jgi:hypothetical protein
MKTSIKYIRLLNNSKAIITEQVLDNLSVFVVAIEQAASCINLRKNLLDEQIEFVISGKEIKKAFRIFERYISKKLYHRNDFLFYFFRKSEIKLCRHS